MLETRAFGAPCDEAIVGPAEIGVRTLGTPRRPCVERRVNVDLRGAAAIDVPSFYGTLDGSSVVGLRWPLAGFEVSADARVVDYELAQDASIKATELGAGPVTFGLLRALAPRGGVALAPALRVIAPFTDSTSGGMAGAIELALHAALRPRRWLAVDGHVAAYGALLTPAGAEAAGLGAALIGVGAALRPARWFAAHGGLEAQSGWYGFGLDHLLARVAIRFRGNVVGAFTLGAALRLAGAERTDVVIGLGWSRPL